MNEQLHIPDTIKDNIIAYLSGSLSPEQAKQLLDWLNEHNDRKQFFYHLTDIWHSTSLLSNLNEFDATKAWQDVMQTLSTSNKKAQRKVNFTTFYKIAAAAVIALLIGISFFFNTKKTSDVTEQFTEMVVPRGSKTMLTLPDGSQVWLNSGSKLAFSNLYGQKTRDIRLNGEAYFIVAKNKKSPFSVFAHGLKITALGTAFDVKAYDDEKLVETSLVEGVLRIGMTENKTGDSIILKPGQRALFTKNNENNKKIIVDSVSDLNLYTSWRNKRWIFRHVTLEELAKTLERRYDINIIFKDSALKEYRISGSLQDEPIEQVLRVLKLIAPIQYKLEHNTINISTDKQLKNKYKNLHLQRNTI